MLKAAKRMILTEQNVIMIIPEPLEIIHSNISIQIGDPLVVKEALERKSSLDLNKKFEIPIQREVEVPEEIKMQDLDPEIIDEEPAAVANYEQYTPIKALNTFMKDWIILARVTAKKMLTTKTNNPMLKIELVD